MLLSHFIVPQSKFAWSKCPLNTEWPTEDHLFIAVITQTTIQTCACVLNVFSGGTFLPVHALHCVSPHCDGLTDVLVETPAPHAWCLIQTRGVKAKICNISI